MLAFVGGAIALWHVGLYFGLVPERIEPCAAGGPSCTDENQLVLGVPLPLLSLTAFGLIATLCTIALRKQ
ncbi:MAG: hypothetical protein AcusKO_42880 [Acuticoccus sp.]